MGEFIKDQLPEPQAYYEGQGLVLQRGGRQWRTTRCQFHGGSDSMRIHLPSGAFVCMAGCGARGGDVVAYHMAAHGISFVQAAKALGAWREGAGKAPQRTAARQAPDRAERPERPERSRPAQPTARAIMSLVHSELTLCAIFISDALRGKSLSEEDAARFREAAGRIQFAANFAGIEEERYD